MGKSNEHRNVLSQSHSQVVRDRELTPGPGSVSTEILKREGLSGTVQ